MDTYSGYNQIPMFPGDEDSTSFITDRGLYCYKVISFGLKNVGATYQRLVNKMFTNQLGRTMEVYVDDMLVKSLQARVHIKHLDEAFQILKKYRMRLNPLKCAFGVASVAEDSVSSVLVREEETHQLPIYCVLQKPDASGRLLKWAVKFSEFDITYIPRTAIKGQALADFVAEFAKAPERYGLQGDVVLESPEGHKLNCAAILGFKASNNVAEYEALLAGLRLANELHVKRLTINSDSQLVVNQVNGNFAARDKHLATYLKLVMDFLPNFEKFELVQVPRDENAHADALFKLASSKDSELLKIVPIEHLLEPLSRREKS
ncbi:unnamed protein product [Fraxinus pennsylvanica]|uniref:RNase H type-1 domain-containing protein n=1 Tax=Fraxinus pennsylvanica TaxID=56036 RepID=A0AAD1ZZ36_9LAMI|nr:unnamed protein product [Fraxinus pennsylvanica]